MCFKQDELEINMLKNIEKQAWFNELLYPSDFEESTKNRNAALERLIDLAKQYSEYIEVESLKSQQELTIYKTGKLDPKSELLKQTEEA